MIHRSFPDLQPRLAFIPVYGRTRPPIHFAHASATSSAKNSASGRVLEMGGRIDGCRQMGEGREEESTPSAGDEDVPGDTAKATGRRDASRRRERKARRAARVAGDKRMRENTPFA